MKDYLASIALFVLAIFFLFSMSMKEVKKTNAARAELENARRELQVAQQNNDIKRLQLKAQVGSDNVQEFIDQYGESLQNMAEINTINQRIASESERLSIPIQEQRTSARELAGRTGTSLKSVPAHEYSISVLADFRDALVWLGNIEDAFPFSRTERVDLTPSGGFVVLHTTIVFPRVDSKAFASNK